MRCQICGHENPELAIYCETCGAVLASKFRTDDPSVRQSKDELARILGRRKATDTIIPGWLIWIPLVIYFVGIIAVLAWFVDALSGATAGDVNTVIDTLTVYLVGLASVLVVYQLIFAVISYYLVRRNNDHSARELALKRWTVQFARNAAGTTEARTAISRDLEFMSTYADDRTPQRVPVVWALLISLPTIGAFLLLLALTSSLEADLSGFIAGIVFLALFTLIGYIAMMYMFYFLTKNQEEHERSWFGFTHTASIVLTRLGVPMREYEPTATPDRSFALYFVLSIFIPFFIYYWWYVLMKDPNEHYRNQWVFEDSLMESLEGKPRSTSSAWLQ